MKWIACPTVPICSASSSETVMWNSSSRAISSSTRSSESAAEVVLEGGPQRDAIPWHAQVFADQIDHAVVHRWCPVRRRLGVGDEQRDRRADGRREIRPASINGPDRVGPREEGEVDGRRPVAVEREALKQGVTLAV